MRSFSETGRIELTDTGETSRQAGAEGATAPETLRPKDRGGQDILERGALDASADGIAISGERTEGATFFRLRQHGAGGVCIFTS
ncbi:hypothetical protein GOX01_08580 [Gluconobacter oxydans]|nr:hypothetical protein GOX01_08580 [Gluconobacter oxydans]